MLGSGSSSVSLLVARRYLRSTRRDAFISFLTFTAAAGLALGVAALILALAMLTGFQSALKEEILARTPEIEIQLPTATGYAEAAEIRHAVTELPEVGAAQLVTRGQGWVTAEGRVRAVELIGFEGELPASFPEASDRAEGLYLGARLADAWGLEPGQVVEVASSKPTLSPFGPQPRVRRLPIHGRYASGRTDLTDRVALPLEQAAGLLGSRGYRVQVATGDLQKALVLAPELDGLVPAGTAIRTWRELNRGLFFALRLEKSLMFVAVFLIVAVASLALVSDLTLIIASKRREVGILGAMGTDPGALRRIFTLLGGLLAGLGVAVGGAVGLGLALFLDRTRLIRIPTGVYFLDYVPFDVRPFDVAVILVATVTVALIGAGYAARRAAALQPVEALRR